MNWLNRRMCLTWSLAMPAGIVVVLWLWWSGKI